MTKEKQYLPLRAGDVRQAGDEFKAFDKETEGVKRNCGYLCSQPNIRLNEWYPVTSLFSYPILPSDLAHLQFRRPVA